MNNAIREVFSPYILRIPSDKNKGLDSCKYFENVMILISFFLNLVYSFDVKTLNATVLYMYFILHSYCVLGR